MDAPDTDLAWLEPIASDVLREHYVRLGVSTNAIIPLVRLHMGLIASCLLGDACGEPHDRLELLLSFCARHWVSIEDLEVATLAVIAECSAVMDLRHRGRRAECRDATTRLRARMATRSGMRLSSAA